MTIRSTRARLLASSIICGAAALVGAGHALAQTSPQAPVGELVVTGSRIPTPNLTSSSPITVVGQQEMTLQGTTNVENVIRDLPAVVADGDNQTTNNSSNGISTIDLRGLGVQRTLTLLDGKRIQPADFYGSVDVNQFPTAIIDHIEVLTGGASSVYGGDAVAGVVNIITKKNFEGIQLSTQNSISGQGDAFITDNNLLLGANSPDGKGNVTVYADFMRRNELYQGAREYGFYALNSPNYTGCATPAIYYQGFCHGGSSYIPEGRVSYGGHLYLFNSSQQLVPHDGRTYNFNPVNYYQTPNTRYAAGAAGHYEINKAVDLYTRLTFSQNDSYSQLAPTPLGTILKVNYGNPLLSAQERDLFFPAAGGPYGPNDTATFSYRQRLAGFGNRVTHDTHDSYQILIGAKGDLGSGWSYDVSAQYGRTDWQRELFGDVNLKAFADGLLVNPDGTCSSGTAGCVPLNIFTTNSISQASVNYAGLNMVGIGETQQQDVQANLVGDLGHYGLKTPWATDGAGIALGAEYRRETSAWMPDKNLGTIGVPAGFGASPAVSGAYYTKEVYGEARIPLIQDAPFAKSFEFDGGFRYADYNLSGGVWSYKGALTWAVNSDIKFRGSYDRAVREPTINELYAAATPSADSGIDPCSAEAAGLHYTTTAALCYATGVLPGEFNSAGLNCGGQCTSHWLSNAALKPETADTWTGGVVFTPSAVRGLVATVDFYDVKIKGAVFRVPLTQVLQQCYDPALNSSQSTSNPSCQAVHRDALGTITTDTGYVDLPYGNIGSLRAQGFDIDLSYRTDLTRFGAPSAWGGVAVELVANLVTKANYTTTVDAPVTNCLQQYGDICGAPQPKWKHNLRVTWTSPGRAVEVSARWRFIGATNFDEVVQNGLHDPQDAHIGTVSYYDLTGVWRINDILQLNAGVRNLFDRSPPLVDINIASAGVDSGNTFPGTYDVIGRTFFFGASARF